MHTCIHRCIHECIYSYTHAYSHALVVVNVANWDNTPIFVKATGACPNRGGPQFAIPLFSHYWNKDMMSSVENFLNRSYVRFESTSTATTACIHTVTTHACHNAHYLATNQREHDLYIIQIQTNSETD